MMRQTLKFLSIAATMLFIPAMVQVGSIPVVNHSFESPVVEPVYPYAYPVAADWIELDNDTDYSANTGVFFNVTNIADADAAQLAFLGSQQGNAFLQDLSAVYQAGKAYRLTVGVCVSALYPPPDPNGLKLSFYYRDPNVVDVAAAQTPPPSHFISTALEDCSVYLPTVEAGAEYVGKPIGIAIRATGPMGGYWDLDNVRVIEFPLVPEFTNDGFVNLADFAKMAAEWLSCSETTADVTGEGCVDGQDLLILTEYWLSHV